MLSFLIVGVAVGCCCSCGVLLAICCCCLLMVVGCCRGLLFVGGVVVRCGRTVCFVVRCVSSVVGCWYRLLLVDCSLFVAVVYCVLLSVRVCLLLVAHCGFLRLIVDAVCCR